MDLKARLEHLGIRRGVGPDHVVLNRSRSISEPPLDVLVEGTWVSSVSGRCLVVERPYSLDYHHGAFCLADASAAFSAAWPHLTTRLGQQLLELSQVAFLDVETTSLNGGAGTYAFLVGLGHFQAGRFWVRQYFMPDYADEEALLDLIAERLAGCCALVTFNGRSFDWPVLEARYILTRRVPPGRDVDHLDLLLWSRRLWRRSLPSCALNALERDVLGIARGADDVPSFLIPELYREYVQYGRTRPLKRVFYHNRMDLLSMVVLAAKIGQILLSTSHDCADPLCDYLSLGAFYERAGCVEEAMRAYELAAKKGACQQQARKRLALLLKRVGRYEEALRIWEASLNGEEVYPYIELAKHYEHRLRDYEQARRILHQALVWLRGRERLLHRSAYHRVTIDLEQRLRRVEKRIAARVGKGSPAHEEKDPSPPVER